MKRIGVKVVIVAFLFWYGLGLLNYSATSVNLEHEVYFLILVFFSIVLLFYWIGYAVPRQHSIQPLVSPTYNVGARSFVLIILAALMCSAFLFVSRGHGMIAYHAVRAEVAVGILVYVYALIFKGPKRAALLIVFAVIVLYTLGAYSRRPFLTLLAPMILIPLMRKRMRLRRAMLFGLVLAAIAGFGIIYVTGLRYKGEATSLFDILAIIKQGFFVFLRGEGFDTVHLTAFVLDTYDESNFLNGGTFFGSFLNFIPRSIWSEKPIAFGVILSGQYFNVGLDGLFTNFGPGIVAEAYANGGYFAIFIVAALFGIIVGIVDQRVEANRYNWNWLLFASVFYPTIFFVVRGDFLNSFYELYSKMLVIWFVTMALRLRRQLRPLF